MPPEGRIALVRRALGLAASRLETERQAELAAAAAAAADRHDADATVAAEPVPVFRAKRPGANEDMVLATRNGAVPTP